MDCYANAEAELVGLPAPITAEVGQIILDGNYPKELEISIFQSMGAFLLSLCNHMTISVFFKVVSLKISYISYLRHGLGGRLCGPGGSGLHYL